MHRSKTERVKQALSDEDWVAALRLASRFHDRSSDTARFERGFDAYRHPGFYRQLRKDPDQLVYHGSAAPPVLFGLWPIAPILGLIKRAAVDA
jgi:hypothetical protein